MSVEMSSPGYRLVLSEDDDSVGYLEIKSRVDGLLKVARSVNVRAFVGNYSGPDIILDFDENNCLLGVEIVG